MVSQRYRQRSAVGGLPRSRPAAWPGGVLVVSDQGQRRARTRHAGVLLSHCPPARCVPPAALRGVCASLGKLAFEREAAAERIMQLDHYDSLTGLPNRSLLQMQASTLLPAARQAGTTLSVLFVDLDRFKHINDSLGHAGGDCKLLREVAQRLIAHAGESALVARLSGDEFALVPARQRPPPDHCRGQAHPGRAAPAAAHRSRQHRAVGQHRNQHVCPPDGDAPWTTCCTAPGWPCTTPRPRGATCSVSSASR
ncbi:diguanylate cyclase domain-containing protein [Cupriavidus basilensis]